jgi:dihydromethanopterin reductase
MAEVRAMLAIGLGGQLGLKGRLPWEGQAARFFAMTRGHVLIAGPQTISTVPAEAKADRTVVEIRSADNPDDVVSSFEGRIVYIGGGPAVWTSYAHLIRHWDITRLPYDGEADRWFDPAWLTGSGKNATITKER